MTRPASPGETPPVHRDDGFSMLETVAALLILSLTSIAALPHLTTVMDNAALERSAMRTATLMRHERNVAMRTGRPTMVAIDTAEGRIGFSSSRAVVDFGRAIGFAAPAGQGSAILFMPDGSSSGGALALGGRAVTYRIVVGDAGSAVTTRRLPGGGMP